MSSSTRHLAASGIDWLTSLEDGLRNADGTPNHNSICRRLELSRSTWWRVRTQHGRDMDKATLDKLLGLAESNGVPTSDAYAKLFAESAT